MEVKGVEMTFQWLRVDTMHVYIVLNRQQRDQLEDLEGWLNQQGRVRVKTAKILKLALAELHKREWLKVLAEGSLPDGGEGHA